MARRRQPPTRYDALTKALMAASRGGPPQVMEDRRRPVKFLTSGYPVAALAALQRPRPTSTVFFPPGSPLGRLQRR